MIYLFLPFVNFLLALKATAQVQMGYAEASDKLSALASRLSQMLFLTMSGLGQ